MVHSCCMVGCANRQNKEAGISLHRIPHFPEERKEAWVKIIELLLMVVNKDYGDLMIMRVFVVSIFLEVSAFSYDLMWCVPVANMLKLFFPYPCKKISKQASSTIVTKTLQTRSYLSYYTVSEYWIVFDNLFESSYCAFVI